MMSFNLGKSWNTLESTNDKIAMLSSVMKWPWNDSRGFLQLARMHQAGNIHLHHLFVKRIPVFIAHRRRLTVTFARVGIDHDADEAEIVDAAIDLIERVGYRQRRRFAAGRRWREIFSAPFLLATRARH